MDGIETGRNIIIIRALILCLVLAACAEPLPEDRLDYAGEWKSPEMYLLILDDGTVKYERLKKGGKVSINGPIKEFEGDSFSVGIGPLTTTFQVTMRPYQVSGDWRMMVDGVELVKTR